MTEHEGGRIRIGLKLFGALRAADRTLPDRLDVPSPATIEGLLKVLRRTDSGLAERIESGISQGYLSVLVNGRNVRFLDGPATCLHDGDRVAFLPPIGGG